MILKGLLDEDFINYSKPSMVLFFPHCTFKCEKECGRQVCQNSTLATAPNIDTDEKTVCARYLSNPITQAIVCGGLEPFDSFEELLSFIRALRNEYKCHDDIVIYTGYTVAECVQKGWVRQLSPFGNIVIKFGRYVPNQKSHYDNVLGINLASDNQYAVKFRPC